MSKLTFTEYVAFCAAQEGWIPIMNEQEFNSIPILAKFATYCMTPPDPKYSLKMNTVEKCAYDRWDHLRCRIEDELASQGLTVIPSIVNRALGKRLFLQAEWLLTRSSTDLEDIIKLISNDVKNSSAPALSPRS